MQLRRASCQTADVQINILRGSAYDSPIMSTVETADLANRLRDEISKLALDGTLSASLEKWSAFASAETLAVFSQEAEQQKSRMFQLGLAGLSMAAFLLTLQTRRTRLAKRAADPADRDELRRQVHRKRSYKSPSCRNGFNRNPCLSLAHPPSDNCLVPNRACLPYRRQYKSESRRK